MAATEGWRAARAGRWCSRFFVVLAGVVASTAAAWAVSTAGAAAVDESGNGLADPITTIAAEVRSHTEEAVEKAAGNTENAKDAESDAAVSVSPVSDAAVDGVNELTTGVTDMAGAGAGAAVEALHGPIVPREARDAVNERRAVRTVSGSADVNAAICDIAERAATRPAHRVFSGFEQVVRDPRNTRQVVERAISGSPEVRELGRTVLNLLDPRAGTDLIGQLPELPTLSGDGLGQPALPTPDQPAPAQASSGTGTPEIFTVEVPSAALDAIGSAVDVRLSIDGSADDARGAGDDREGKTPVQPVRIPLAPITAPTVPGGTHGAGHLDGTTFGVPAGAFAAFDDIVIGEIRSGVRHLQVSPGAQPGVTPD
ncbi:hypothetical protein [Amycolatopsis marina]|uniref:hypothetical protein n=1 Tax=Amycolatopsis marina TaxID=490629 RepID=UPI0011604864|nr:hypothetical protein [Amycolatopsis marina]